MKDQDCSNCDKISDTEIRVEKVKTEVDIALQESSIKYARRSKRTIGDASFILSEPSLKTSMTMQKVRSSNTSIEILIENKLKEYRISYARADQLIDFVEGNPDFVIPKHKIAIFCDGDFWHGFNLSNAIPKKNNEFWRAKIVRNVQRDSEVNKILGEKEWKVFRFWEHEIRHDADSCVKMVRDYIESEFSLAETKFTFIDLFSGVGGFRIALEGLGGKCLGFSEIDKHSIEVYKNNFCDFQHEDELELGDITKLDKLPFTEIDLIVGGVPCQSWSVAGKMRGFDDPRGRLWDDTIRVVEKNQPKAFIFENVKGLMDPRNRANLDLIESRFRKAGYSVKTALLNSFDFGLPQNRDRVFIVGIKKSLVENLKPFQFPSPVESKCLLSDLIENLSNTTGIKKQIFDPSDLFGGKVPFGRNRFQKDDELNDFFVFCDTRNGHTTIHSWDIIKTSEREKEICMAILRNRRKKAFGVADGNPLSYVALSDIIGDLKESELEKLITKKILRFVPDKGYEFVNSKNSAGINGIYRVYLPHSHIFSTLTATGTKDVIAKQSVSGTTPEEYKQNFIDQIIKKKLYRSITGKESGRLQGFPGWFAIHKDEKLAKKQFGNAVSTWVIYYLGKSLIDTDIFNQEHDRTGTYSNN